MTHPMNTPRTEMDGMGKALEQVMALADKATSGEWVACKDIIGVKSETGFKRHILANLWPEDDEGIDTQAFVTAAINFLRQHGPTLAALVADGERYRYLRLQADPDLLFAVIKNPFFDVYETPEELDAAIDAARAGGGRD